MQKINQLKAVMILLFTFIAFVQAETFCVSDGAELSAALNIADSNNEADHIKLRIGDYKASNIGFRFTAVNNDDHDLEISGKWVPLNNESCGGRLLTDNPFDRSRITPDFKSSEFLLSLLFIKPGAHANVKISFVNIENAESFDPDGVGLNVNLPLEYSGNFLIENNVFQGSESPKGAGLDISARFLGEGGSVVVRNNLIHNNLSDNPINIDVKNFPGHGNNGLYFTNNTVYNNSYYGSPFIDSAGVSIRVNGLSRALIANNLLWANDSADGNRDLILLGDGYKYLFNNNIGVLAGTNISVEADEASGNFSVAPVFEDGFWNFQPVLDSAVINAGIMPAVIPHNPPLFEENWQLGSLDLYGRTRVNEGAVDVGAIESDVIFVDSFE